MYFDRIFYKHAKGQYPSWEDLAKDVALVVPNCWRYDGYGSHNGKIGGKLDLKARAKFPEGTYTSPPVPAPHPPTGLPPDAAPHPPPGSHAAMPAPPPAAPAAPREAEEAEADAAAAAALAEDAAAAARATLAGGSLDMGGF